MTNTTTMTTREFFAAVAADETIAANLREFASAEIEKMDTANLKRAAKNAEKKSAENAPLIAAVRALFETNEMVLFAKDVLDAGIEGIGNVSKASAILRQMEKDGVLKSEDMKHGKSKAKGYTLITD